MRIFIKMKIVLLLTTVIFLSVGCAAIINGPRQDIFLETEPAGAKVIVKGRGTTITPSVINLPRNKSYIIHFEKEGYKPVEVKLKRNLDILLIIGSCCLLGPFGPIIDFATRSAFKLNPSEVNVELEKE